MTLRVKSLPGTQYYRHNDKGLMTPVNPSSGQAGWLWRNIFLRLAILAEPILTPPA